MNPGLKALTAGLILLSLTGCYLSFEKNQPTATPLPPTTDLSTPTALVPLGTAAPPVSSLPTGQFVTAANPSQPTAALQPAAEGAIVVGAASGPYGVIGVEAADALNIRSGPGVSNGIVGTFGPSANTVMRTGRYTTANGDPWVEVQNPAGGTGWVHAGYLTEYVAPASFCSDARVNTLIGSFGNALKISNGEILAGLVSPAHGWSVSLWRSGNTVVFDPGHAQWVFDSTYSHDWGLAPASGLSTTGSIHAVVFPKYLDVFNAAGYSLVCDAIQTGGASYTTAWPGKYANINFYSVYKPGPTGNELSWRTLLIGVEYVGGQPYIFSTTQLEWEP